MAVSAEASAWSWARLPEVVVQAPVALWSAHLHLAMVLSMVLAMLPCLEEVVQTSAHFEVRAPCTVAARHAVQPRLQACHGCVEYFVTATAIPLGSLLQQLSIRHTQTAWPKASQKQA